jgi:hypothetical protein
VVVVVVVVMMVVVPILLRFDSAVARSFDFSRRIGVVAA